MTESKLRTTSISLIRDVDKAGQETSFMEYETNNGNQETELDRNINEVRK